MQKEILELHNLIKLKNIDKAYVETKKLYKLEEVNFKFSDEGSSIIFSNE